MTQNLPRVAADPGRRPRAKLFELAKRWAVPVMAATAAAVILTGRAQDLGTSVDDPQLAGPPWRGQVTRLLTRGGKLEVCAPSGSPCRAAGEGDDVPAGSQLRTGRATLADVTFADGSSLSLDHDTTLRLSTRRRGAELTKGALVADVQPLGGLAARFEFPGGHLDVVGTKFSLRSDDASSTVEVARGEVRLSDGHGHDARVSAGEEGRVDDGSRPVTGVMTRPGDAFSWSDAVRLASDAESEDLPRAVGELKAQKPGEHGERADAVRLDSHRVNINISGSVARTEVEEIFSNRTDDVLEGIFRFPLPPDAKLERLALEVDGKLEEGAFVDRERASAIWRGALVNAAPQLRPELKDEIVWVPGPWRDPALLEWQRGGRFELRIFPIPRRGSRRVVLAYSQLVPQAASVRHYSYPLALDPSGRATPLAFSLDVQVRGHDPTFRLRTPGWDVSHERAAGAEHLHFDSQAFVSEGNFRLDYALPERSSEVSAWAYRDTTANGDAARPYFALTLRPHLPKPQRRGSERAVALLVDASRSMYGENYHRATVLATRLARELESTELLTVLACDTTCRELPGVLRAGGERTALEVQRFLEHETPAGASDVTFGVSRAFATLAGSGRAAQIIYIGDGTATVGPTRPATIERAVRAALPPGGHVTSIGVGPDSDPESLRAMARGGAGTAVPYVPGQALTDVAMSAIFASSGVALSDAHLELPNGISQVAPVRLDTIVSGSELVVTGRLDGPGLVGDAVLRGNIAGRPFEQRYRLDVTASDSAGNAFVPRLFASSRIADLERDGSDESRREAVALSTKHGVASRYTSLLVLESEAMYKAFGIDRARQASEYTADVDADGSSASGELALSEDAPEPEQPPTPSTTADKSRDLSAHTAPPTAPRAAAGGRQLGSDQGSGLGDESEAPTKKALRLPARGPAFAPPPPAPTASATPDAEPPLPDQKSRLRPDNDDLLDGALVRPRFRSMIAMRRVWERKGEVFTDRFVPRAASNSALNDAAREMSRDSSRRQALKRAFALSSAAGDLGEAARLAERWLEKEPLDPEALTAAADIEARRGRRDSAIRMLGSVIDVRPGDTASHKRLARLERWSGHAELACRHSIALAEGRGQDAALLADALRCARDVGLTSVADTLLEAAPERTRDAAEKLMELPPTDDTRLNGDLRLDATWSGGLDLDLSLLDTEGHRIAWLGAGTRAVISARNAISSSNESLAVRGAAAGEYVIELTRGAGTGDATGELVVSAAGTVRRIPFHFDTDRKPIALVRISVQSRLVPL